MILQGRQLLDVQFYLYYFYNQSNITVTMNLQSPTSLLSSIQQMKTKLRSDKQTLIDIKNDFTKFSKKANPYTVPSRQQNLTNQKMQNRKDRDSSEDIQAQIRQIRRDHQKQISRLIEKHEKQLNEIIRIKQKEKEDVQNKWRVELENQKRYINILQSQISSNNVEKRETVADEQYSSVINKLLKENTELHQRAKQLQQQSNQWKLLYQQTEAQKSSKSRFKFSKAKKDDSIMRAYQTERQSLSNANNIDRVYTYGSQYGKENMNYSNISSGNKWDKIQINHNQQIFQNANEIQKNVLEQVNAKKSVKKSLSLKFEQ